MNIALVSHNVIHGDGQGRVNVEIARYALEKGAQVTLVADAVAPSLIEAGAQWIPVHPTFSGVNLWKTWDFARRANPIATRLRGEGHLVVGCGFSLNVPHDVNVVHFVHAAWLASSVHTARAQSGPYAWYQWLYSTANSRWERSALSKAHTVACVSPTVRGDVCERLEVPEHRTEIIPNGVDLTEFTTDSVSRASLNLPSGPLALFVGDIRTPRKNLETVLRALAQTSGLHLAVVGDPNGSPYPALAEVLDVADRVHFLGYRRDVPALMRAADVFVAPSHYEPFSLVVLEALASGCPVVTARTVGASFLVTPDVGIVIDRPDDDTALADALETILDRLDSNRSHYDSMCRTARATAERYGWRTMARQYYNLFDAVSHEASRR